MNDIMFDLETLGLLPGCGITEIGWCCFSASEYKVSQAFGVLIPIEQSLLYGFKRDAATIKWWLEEQGGFPELTPELKHMTLPQILSSVAAQWNELWYAGVQRLWSKPTTFDIPILQEAFDMVSVERPIILRPENFWRWRDMMTIVMLEQPPTDAYAATSKQKTAHRAKEDAENQARRVSSILSMQQAMVKDALNCRRVMRHEVELQEQNRRQATVIRLQDAKLTRWIARGRKQNASKPRKR